MLQLQAAQCSEQSRAGRRAGAREPAAVPTREHLEQQRRGCDLCPGCCCKRVSRRQGMRRHSDNLHFIYQSRRASAAYAGNNRALCSLSSSPCRDCQKPASGLGGDEDVIQGKPPPSLGPGQHPSSLLSVQMEVCPLLPVPGRSPSIQHLSRARFIQVTASASRALAHLSPGYSCLHPSAVRPARAACCPGLLRVQHADRAA